MSAERGVEVVSPIIAGQYDPTMQAWLALPVAVVGRDEGEFEPDVRCPNCAGAEWGTANPRGYFLVRVCHLCSTKFRGEVTAYMIHKIIGALLGENERFAR